MNNLQNEDIPTYYYITKNRPKMINGTIEINKNFNTLLREIKCNKDKKKEE